MEWVAGNVLDVSSVSGVIITCRDTTKKETKSATPHV
jgi:hypothetical protein